MGVRRVMDPAVLRPQVQLLPVRSSLKSFLKSARKNARNPSSARALNNGQSSNAFQRLACTDAPCAWQPLQLELGLAAWYMQMSTSLEALGTELSQHQMLHAGRLRMAPWAESPPSSRHQPQRSTHRPIQSNISFYRTFLLQTELCAPIKQQQTWPAFSALCCSPPLWLRALVLPHLFGQSGLLGPLMLACRPC